MLAAQWASSSMAVPHDEPSSWQGHHQHHPPQLPSDAFVNWTNALFLAPALFWYRLSLSSALLDLKRRFGSNTNQTGNQTYMQAHDLSALADGSGPPSIKTDFTLAWKGLGQSQQLFWYEVRLTVQRSAVEAFSKQHPRWRSVALIGCIHPALSNCFQRHLARLSITPLGNRKWPEGLQTSTPLRLAGSGPRDVSVFYRWSHPWPVSVS